MTKQPVHRYRLRLPSGEVLHVRIETANLKRPLPSGPRSKPETDVPAGKA